MSENADSTVTIHRTYSLLRPIGEGSIKTVFEGVEPASGQHVAIRVLNAEHAGNIPIQERFEGETAVLTSVDHPGSISVYGTGNLAGGRPFFVMKKIEGRLLRDLLIEGGERAGDLV
jgi:serine/threonine-protein kinase